MMMRAVLSAAFGERRYSRLLRRLERSLDEADFTGRRLIWRDELPPFSLPHASHPYAFKLAAFVEAATGGVDLALWLDSACVALRPLDQLFDHVERHGVLLFDNPPHNCGEWTSDAALPLLGFRDRDQAMGVPQCTASVVGLDLTSSLGARFLASWLAHLRCGAFAGERYNIDRRMSGDPRCLGHRHDQSSASALAWLMGIPLLPGAPWFTDVKVRRPDAATIVALDRRRALG